MLFARLLVLTASFSAAVVLATSTAAPSASTDDPLGRIKHVVVLCLENRSFDHVFGFLNHTRDIDNLRDKPYLFNQVNADDPQSERVYVGPGASWIATQDPGHYVSLVTEQLYGKRSVQRPYPEVAPMDGFLQSAYELFNNSLPTATQVMRSFRPNELPALTTLAQEYAVFDRWFASLPGPTQPNRSYLHSATSNGETNNQRWHMRLGYPQRTIYQSLHEAGKNFAVYYHDGPTPGLFRWVRRPDIFLRYVHSYEGHLDSRVGGFKNDVKKGKLPEYTFIDPRYFDRKAGLLHKAAYANDDHPPHDLRRGQSLIKEVYETLRASPIWESTLLIITYDEHGGYYDHVPPPFHGVPNPDGKVGDGASFDRLGVRVPTVMISPWIRKGTVVHEPPETERPDPTSQYEHSSVPATVKKLFGLPNFLTKRDAWAGTFEHIWMQLDQPRTDCPLTVPDQPVQLTRRDGSSSSMPPLAPFDDAGPLTDMQAALVEVVHGMKGTPMTPQEAVEVIDEAGDSDMSKEEAQAFVHQGMADLRGEPSQ